jgi:hypothetical protein
MPTATATTTLVVQAPTFSIGLGADRGDAEKADVVVATLNYTNMGSGPALRAWANWTFGGNYVLSSLTPSVPYASTPSGFDVALANVAPGDHDLVARLTVTRGLSDGLSMPIQVRWVATDGNGNPLPPATVFVAVGLKAPVATIYADPATTRAEVDAVFTLNVTLRNSGRARADGWLNVSLPPGMEYMGDNGTFPSSLQSGYVTWTVSIPAGGTDVMGVRFRGRQDLLVSVRFSLDYSDGKGSPAVNVVSGSLSISVVAAASPGWTIPAIVIGAVAAVIGAVFLLWRRRRSDVTVEDIFVSDLGGVLLAHRSATIVPYEDEDALVGMFKVVQDFVRDAFSKGREEEMRAVEFGGRTIMIENGSQHILSVVYRGTDRGELADRVRRVSREIDDTFGETIRSWSGDVDVVRGITLLLPKIWKSTPRSRAKS